MMNGNNRGRPRQGNISLIEVVVLMFATSVALGLVGSSLASLARVDAKFDRLATGASDVDRLLRRLRADLHAAQDVAIDDTTLTLRMPGGQSTITYRLAIPRSSREHADHITHYKTTGGARWIVSVERLSNERLLKVSIRGEVAGAVTANDFTATLVAEVGRNLRTWKARKP